MYANFVLLALELGLVHGSAMDSWLQAILLGIVQGLTEFLPVSSSGHLVLAQAWLGEDFEFRDIAVAFDLVLHVGTLVPVLYYYRDSIAKMLRSLSPASDDQASRSLVGWVLLATIPTGLMGLLLKDSFEALFHNPDAVAFALFVTGGLLLVTRRQGDGQGRRLNWWIAILIGIGQGFAITPGISRSGTTIALGLLLGLDRETAARFSFLLSIPAIAGAAVLVAKDGVSLPPGTEGALGLGFVSSVAVGYMALVLLVRLVQRGGLHWFTAYLWPIALLAWLLL